MDSSIATVVDCLTAMKVSLVRPCGSFEVAPFVDPFKEGSEEFDWFTI